MAVNELTASLGLKTEAWDEGLKIARTSMDAFVKDMQAETIDFTKMFAGIDESIVDVKEKVQLALTDMIIPVKTELDETTLKSLEMALQEVKATFDTTSIALIDEESAGVFKKDKLIPKLEESFSGQNVSLKEISFDLTDADAESIAQDIEKKLKPEISLDEQSLIRAASQIEGITQPVLNIMGSIDHSMGAVDKAVQGFKDVNIGGDIESLTSAVSALNQVAMKLVKELDV